MHKYAEALPQILYQHRACCLNCTVVFVECYITIYAKCLTFHRELLTQCFECLLTLRSHDLCVLHDCSKYSHMQIIHVAHILWHCRCLSTGLNFYPRSILLLGIFIGIWPFSYEQDIEACIWKFDSKYLNIWSFFESKFLVFMAKFYKHEHT